MKSKKKKKGRKVKRSSGRGTTILLTVSAFLVGAVGTQLAWEKLPSELTDPIQGIAGAVQAHMPVPEKPATPTPG